MGRTACTEPQCLYKCALYLTLFITYMFPSVIYKITMGPKKEWFTNAF